MFEGEHEKTELREMGEEERRALELEVADKFVLGELGEETASIFPDSISSPSKKHEGKFI